MPVATGDWRFELHGGRMEDRTVGCVRQVAQHGGGGERTRRPKLVPVTVVRRAQAPDGRHGHH